jgi:hypothetical protein
MKIKNTIFASKPEERVFKSLESRWSPQFKIWLALSLSNLFRLEASDVTQEERRFFNATSVDYTLCNSSYRPLLSIEFDGMGGGFSRDGIYVPGRIGTDPMRKVKLDFKLKCAKKLDYPFFVVSYEEAEPLDKEDTLTILDAIIGQVLARKEFLQKMNELADEYHGGSDQAASLEDYELKQELIEDTITSCEVESELKMDPVARKAAEYSGLCAGLGIGKYSLRYLSDPELPDFSGIDDIKGLKARIEAMKFTVREGCQITIEMPGHIIEKTVWVRNFESYGVSSYSIARNIAEYLGFKKVYSLLPKM